MCFKSLTLLGLISLVALTGAKLRWKCELFDTSQETSTRTTFVEFVNGKPPEPSITDPNDPQNPRTPRSTPKCRPRPKNGTIPQTTQTEKLVVQKNRNIIQSDVPGSSFSGGDVVPNIKYQRKETHQSLDLNIGPGFEESNDPYGKSKMPVPKRVTFGVDETTFRPAELKGADELDKPLAEHLDENVMPDFEFDDDDVPPVAEDLPWCPEETEVDCETADLDKLSISELVELKQRCESTVSAERFRLIENMIKTETNRGVEGIPDSDNKAPPTGTTNCSTSPSDLSEATLKKYREECPCEDDTSKMSEKEFEVFKKECLDPINGPGKPYLRKNGRCGASQKMTDTMSEKEYKLFVKECLVQPNNIKLEKILIIENKPECTDVKMKGISKSEFSEFKKNCVTSKTCDDVDKSRLNEKELITLKKMCSPTTRKTNSICDERDVDGLDEEQFDRYMKECFLREEKNYCESVDLDSLSELEYEKYKERCQENPINCEDANPKDLTGIEYKMYQKECLGSGSPPPRVVPPIDCGKTNPDTLNRRDYEEYDSLCLKPMNCKTTNPDELTDKEYKRYQKKCLQKSASECAKINPRELTDEEYKKYEDECLEKEVNCTTADSREMTKEQYKRFEKVCLKSKSDCKDVEIKKLNDEEYEKFRKDCLKNPPKYDCFDVNLDVLTEEEYQEYKAECLKECLERKSSGNCDTINPDDLSDEEYENYKKNCLRKKPRFSCEDVNVDELNREEYKKYQKECSNKVRRPDCDIIRPEELNEKEYAKYKRECLDSPTTSSDCENAKINEMSEKQLQEYEEECLPKNRLSKDCGSINPKKLSDEEYEKYQRACLPSSSSDCNNVNINELTDEEFSKYKKKCSKRPSSPTGPFAPGENVEIQKTVIINTPGGGVSPDYTNHSEKTLLGRKMSSYSPDDQSNNDMDHEQIIMKKKKKRTYRIGPDGKRELVGEEVIGGDRLPGEMSVAKKMRKIGKLFGENKNTFSPEPLNDSNGGDASQNDQNDNSGMGMTTHKRRRFYEIGPDGKKKLVRTEGGGDDGTSGEEVIGTKKTKRFYSVGKDGKRTLLRTENSGGKPAETPDSEPAKPLKNDVDPPGKDTKLVLNRRGFFKGGHLSVPDESEEKRDDGNDKQGSMMKKAAQPADDDGYEYEMKPRVKRTYVLDGKGNRKLVNEQTGDEQQDIDLGKLLRTRRKVVETETVDREHQERRFMKKKSVKSTRSSSMNGENTNPINKKRKMQKYHKDSSLRSGGKSEEDIPKEM
ncbi:hypothetical protein CAEBREN_29478 [Caenorhabditis brenneri]|uniref:Uncharacterized protein n=1 Tax=Caenorhabditis brenneri TaxID=135651 RepID=G0NLH3_CAEBE|nr:hypothetical protein CAEBREN_29478 [Caenorhabditis brenneri]